MQRRIPNSLPGVRENIAHSPGDFNPDRLSLNEIGATTLAGLHPKEQAKCEYLYCRDNLLSTVEGLGPANHLTQLKYLDLSSNEIGNLQGFPCCEALRQLHLSSNHLTEVSGQCRERDSRDCELTDWQPYGGVCVVSRDRTRWLPSRTSRTSPP